jgi:hypothetical protein
MADLLHPVEPGPHSVQIRTTSRARLASASGLPSPMLNRMSDPVLVAEVIKTLRQRAG